MKTPRSYSEVPHWKLDLPRYSNKLKRRNLTNERRGKSAAPFVIFSFPSYFILTRMKKLGWVLSFGPAVNLTLPFSGVPKVMSTLSADMS